MHKTLLEKLKAITPKEEAVLTGKKTADEMYHMILDEFVYHNKALLEQGKLIEIQPHTRFIHYPKHVHDYVEIIYMFRGTTTHIINDTTTITLKTGDLLFLNQYVTQEVLPASYEDLAISFVILPEFFRSSFLLSNDDEILRSFILSVLERDYGTSGYLYFETSNILPIQNLMENLIWSISSLDFNSRTINQATMGLLFLHLLNHIDEINIREPRRYEQHLVFKAYRYVEENYLTASLEEFAASVNQPSYYISKIIKKHSSYTFKEYVQRKRLTQAIYYLLSTTTPIEEIISEVGYDNSSYFHRLFKKTYGMTPKQYRESHMPHS